MVPATMDGVQIRIRVRSITYKIILFVGGSVLLIFCFLSHSGSAIQDPRTSIRFLIRLGVVRPPKVCFPPDRLLPTWTHYYNLSSWTTLSDILPLPPNALRLFRPWPDEQLHREPLRRLHQAHRKAFHQYGGCDPQFQSRHITSTKWG